jgi:glycosyltransferase involved in cell wall biosynthesis
VILCFRNFDGIQETIEKIAKQTYERIELVISDDCSANFDAKTIEEMTKPYSNRFENIIVNKNKTNMGTVKHINSLFEKLHGDIILYQGCDDVLYDTEVISDVVKYFERTNADIVTTQRVAIPNDNSEIILPELLDAEAIQRGTKYLLHYIVKKGNVVSGCGTFYNRNVFEKYGYFDERCRLVEDYSYYMNFLQNGGVIHFLPRKTLKYAWGGVSTSRNPLVEADRDIVFQKIIYPNLEQYSWGDRRILRFRKERILADGKIGIYLMFKYPDVILKQGIQELVARKQSAQLSKKMEGNVCK